MILLSATCVKTPFWDLGNSTHTILADTPDRVNDVAVHAVAEMTVYVHDELSRTMRLASSYIPLNKIILKEKMETTSVLLEIAKKDLEATKILFNNKLHAHAIFYLQQCIEKAIKSYGIKLKIISELEAKDEIGHKALKVFSKSYDQFRKKIATLDFLEVMDKKYPLNKSAIDKLPKTFPTNEESKVSFSREEFLNIVSKITRAKDWLKKFIEPVKTFSQLLDTLYESYPTEEKEAEIEAAKRQIDAFVNEWNTVYSKMFSCLSTLYYLNLIFSPHSVNSRYPERDFNPLEIYNDKMPLIEQLSSFIKITDETLDDLEQIYTQNKLASFWSARAIGTVFEGICFLL